MWNAKPLDEYYKDQSKKGIKFSDASKKLKLVDYFMAEYGDWSLYEDDEGNLWQDYFSIGD